MSDLKPSTRALLELGRLGDEPTDEAVGQNRQALAKKLGVAALGASAVAGSTSKATAAVLAGGWTIAKAVVLGGVVLLGAAVTWKVVEPGGNTGRSGSLSSQSVPPAPQLPAPTSVAPPAFATPTPTPSTGDLAPAETPAPATHAAPSSRAPAARSIKEELELLRAAQQALNRGEPQAALALLAEHAQKFPSGVLSEDREASRVFALCRLGNVVAARAAADAFIRRAPKSPFVDRVRGACRPAGAGSVQ